jgi:hypothetical protein
LKYAESASKKVGDLPSFDEKFEMRGMGMQNSYQLPHALTILNRKKYTPSC